MQAHEQARKYLQLSTCAKTAANVNYLLRSQIKKKPRVFDYEVSPTEYEAQHHPLIRIWSKPNGVQSRSSESLFAQKSLVLLYPKMVVCKISACSLSLSPCVVSHLCICRETTLYTVWIKRQCVMKLVSPEIIQRIRTYTIVNDFVNGPMTQLYMFVTVDPMGINTFVRYRWQQFCNTDWVDIISITPWPLTRVLCNLTTIGQCDLVV